MNSRVVSPAGFRSRGRGLPRPAGSPRSRDGRSSRGAASGMSCSSSSETPPAAVVRHLHRGERHLHHVELVGERLHDHPEAVEVVLQDRLADRGLDHLQPPGPQVGDRRHLQDLDPLAREALDVLQHPVLARLGERDGHALAAGPADAADAVDVRLGGRGHVVVDDVGELVDVESARGDVGRDQEVGRPRPQAPHHPVPLLLRHAAVQGLRAVAAAVERVGELIHLDPRAAEHDRRRRRLHVEHPGEGGGLVGARDDVGALAHQRRLARGGLLARDADPDRVGEVAAGDRADARGHGRREEHGLRALGRAGEDRVDVLGEAHVEHLVGLVEHHDREPVEVQRAPPEVVERPARGRDDDVGPAARAPSADARSAGRRRPARPAPRGHGRSGGSPRRPASPARGWAPAPAPAAPRARPSPEIRCSSGRANAAVLPVPVAASPSRSLPSRSGGMASAWIGVGSS